MKIDQWILSKFCIYPNFVLTIFAMMVDSKRSLCTKFQLGAIFFVLYYSFKEKISHMKEKFAFKFIFTIERRKFAIVISYTHLLRVFGDQLRLGLGTGARPSRILNNDSLRYIPWTFQRWSKTMMVHLNCLCAKRWWMNELFFLPRKICVIYNKWKFIVNCRWWTNEMSDVFKKRKCVENHFNEMTF